MSPSVEGRSEVLVRGNLRPMLWGLLVPLLGVALGLWLAGFLTPQESLALRALGWVLIAAGAVVSLAMILVLSRPRLALADRRLLVYAGVAQPVAVPLEIVECFLLGQGPVMLPGKRNERRETVTLVVKLADSAEEWAKRPMQPILGYWCGGYITLRGTWCERLDVALVNRLNARLAEVQRQAAAGASSP